MRASRKAQESAEKAKQALKWQNSKKGKNTKRGGETEPPKATDKVIAKEKPTEKAAVNVTIFSFWIWKKITLKNC